MLSPSPDDPRVGLTTSAASAASATAPEITSRFNIMPPFSGTHFQSVDAPSSFSQMWRDARDHSLRPLSVWMRRPRGLEPEVADTLFSSEGPDCRKCVTASILIG